MADLLQQEVASIIQKDIKDPRVGFVTITGADVSPDLRQAKIFYTVFGDEKKREETREGLARARSYIRREVSRVLSLKVTPDLNFVFDESVERGLRLDDLIDSTRPAADPEEGEDDEPR